MLTKIQLWGSHKGIILTSQILNEVGLKMNDSVNVCVEGDRIIISKLNTNGEADTKNSKA